MNPSDTAMYREAAEAGTAVARQYAENAGIVARAAAQLRAADPAMLLTLARGSSDNAATFLRYLVETRLGVATGSFAPSIASVYGATPRFERAVVVAISQSGRSPDLLAAAEAATAGGARLIGMVNDAASPLALLSSPLMPLHAGPEKSVAATKSFIATLAASLHLVAEWAEDAALKADLETLPSLLDAAFALDWSAALPVLETAENLYVVARGPALGVAQEMALKIKETCGFHAEAFSAAEVKHGPMALVREGFPVLIIAQRDESLESVEELAQLFAEKGATLLSAGLPSAPGIRLPLPDAPALLQPMLAVEAFYRFVNMLSVARGHDPDSPPGLRKVTETL